jgi:hypothetical protein
MVFPLPSCLSVSYNPYLLYLSQCDLAPEPAYIHLEQPRCHQLGEGKSRALKSGGQHAEDERQVWHISGAIRFVTLEVQNFFSLCPCSLSHCHRSSGCSFQASLVAGEMVMYQTCCGLAEVRKLVGEFSKSLTVGAPVSWNF